MYRGWTQTDNKRGYNMYRGWTQTDNKIGYNMYRGWTQTYYQMRLQHVQRMDTNRLPNVATTCTEDGHKQTTKTSTTI